MLELLDEALTIEHRPNIDVFVGDGHYACAPMVEGLADRGLILVSKLRRWPVADLPPAAASGSRTGAQVCRTL